MTPVLTTPINGSETLESMIGTAIASTERWVTGWAWSGCITSVALPPLSSQAGAMSPLPQKFQAWFASRGWSPRPHQLAVLEHSINGRNALLISPTGGGKTLAGFLPSLVELAEPHARSGIHTLYVSPLKALAVDIARNLEAPVAEMGLPVAI